MMNRMLYKHCLWSALLACLALGTFLPSVRAEKKAEPAKEKPTAEQMKAALDVETLLTAYKLAEFGRQTKTAEALATAALLIAKTPHADVKLPKDKEDGVEVSASDPKAEANALLAEAKKLDPEGKAVAEIAAKVSDLLRESSRDAKGVVSLVLSLPPGKSQALNLLLFFTPFDGVGPQSTNAGVKHVVRYKSLTDSSGTGAFPDPVTVVRDSDGKQVPVTYTGDGSFGNSTQMNIYYSTAGFPCSITFSNTRKGVSNKLLQVRVILVSPNRTN